MRLTGLNKEDFVTDKEAQELCDKVGGDKYMTCSSLKGRGINEIFQEVCKCCLGDNTEQSSTCGGCKIL